MEKTNVMRILDSAAVTYTPYEYDENITDGEMVAGLLGEDPSAVFKTLVTVANTGEHFVFVVPVNMTLHLKKAAKSVGAKSVEMIKQKELFPLTGYIHGGCSPVGMKKGFVTVIDETALCYDDICVSAGHIGRQIKTNPERLAALVGASFADIACEK